MENINTEIPEMLKRLFIVLLLMTPAISGATGGNYGGFGGDRHWDHDWDRDWGQKRDHDWDRDWGQKRDHDWDRDRHHSHNGNHECKHNKDCVHTVPEPTTLVLLGIGVAGIGFTRRKKT